MGSGPTRAQRQKANFTAAPVSTAEVAAVDDQTAAQARADQDIKEGGTAQPMPELQFSNGRGSGVVLHQDGRWQNIAEHFGDIDGGPYAIGRRTVRQIDLPEIVR